MFLLGFGFWVRGWGFKIFNSCSVSFLVSVLCAGDGAGFLAPSAESWGRKASVGFWKCFFGFGVPFTTHLALGNAVSFVFAFTCE